MPLGITRTEDGLFIVAKPRGQILTTMGTVKGGVLRLSSLEVLYLDSKGVLAAEDNKISTCKAAMGLLAETYGDAVFAVLRAYSDMRNTGYTIYLMTDHGEPGLTIPQKHALWKFYLPQNHPKKRASCAATEPDSLVVIPTAGLSESLPFDLASLQRAAGQKLPKLVLATLSGDRLSFAYISDIDVGCGRLVES